MAGAIAHTEAEALRATLEQTTQAISPEARNAFLQLIAVLESSPDAVVLPVDDSLSTQQAAELLGVSRMTVVRLIDRGDITAEAGGGSHRRVAVSELARYRRDTASRRQRALSDLALDIDEDTPPDRVVNTR